MAMVPDGHQTSTYDALNRLTAVRNCETSGICQPAGGTPTLSVMARALLASALRSPPRAISIMSERKRCLALGSI